MSPGWPEEKPVPKTHCRKGHVNFRVGDWFTKGVAQLRRPRREIRNPGSPVPPEFADQAAYCANRKNLAALSIESVTELLPLALLTEFVTAIQFADSRSALDCSVKPVPVQLKFTL